MSYRRLLRNRPPLLGSMVQWAARAFYALAERTGLGRAFLETRDTQAPVTLKSWYWQRLCGYNGRAYWPMHPSSEVVWPQHICVGIECAPGLSPGCRLNGRNGIYIGDYTQISQNVGIISANHDPYDLAAHLPAKPIRIGRYCLIGMNAMILPGVELGDYTIVAANAVVTECFPEGFVVLAGAPAKPVKKLDPTLAKDYRSPFPYHGYIRAADFDAFKAKHLKLK